MNKLADVSVLLVEDDKIDVEAVRRSFRKSNLTNPIHHVSSGASALDALRGENGTQKIQQPCVMLVDINMPQMSGLELLSKVKNDPLLKKNIAFILTTSEREADIEAAYSLNAAGYFLKDNLDKLTAMFGLYKDINRFPKG